MASSEDERPWPSSTTFGSLPRKENGMPGMPGGIWSSHSRGSFKLSDQARRNAAREARLGAPNTHAAARAAQTPSPATSEGAASLPFAIPLQPTPKAGRSLSHSQGQRELPLPSPQAHIAGGEQQIPVLPLGLLAETEEADTETESELGTPITQTYSHPPIGSLQRTSTYPNHYDTFHASNNINNRRADTFSDAIPGQRLDKRFEAAFADLNLDQSSRRSQWQTSLGWEDLPNVNESRRHSLADIPTRRGSLVGAEQPIHVTGNVIQTREQLRPQTHHSNNHHFLPQDAAHIDSHTRHTRPDQHSMANPAPYVGIEQIGRGGAFNPMPGAVQKPKKHLYLVTFKCSRVGVFYLLDNTGLNVNEGDMVIVEADRGQDCGQVVRARITAEEAKSGLEHFAQEQYKWLMMFSNHNNSGKANPNAAVYGESSIAAAANAAAQTTFAPQSAARSRDLIANLKPKAIKRMAATHEIKMLKEKEGNEAKAKRMCQQKVDQHRLDMEILEAEFQWDWNKLIFYYYADHYVNFKDLVNDLYKFYKVRLWMSAVNPASFSPNAIGQPPSGVGPGAITAYGRATEDYGHSKYVNPYQQQLAASQNQFAASYDSSYAMAYGSDPDPYGAIPPYTIGYDTHVPNYPSIPGMPNSFAPSPGNGMPANPTYGQWPSASAGPSVTETAQTPIEGGVMPYYYGGNGYGGSMAASNMGQQQYGGTNGGYNSYVGKPGKAVPSFTQAHEPMGAFGTAGLREALSYDEQLGSAADNQGDKSYHR